MAPALMLLWLAENKICHVLYKNANSSTNAFPQLSRGTSSMCFLRCHGFSRSPFEPRPWRSSLASSDPLVCVSFTIFDHRYIYIQIHNRRQDRVVDYHHRMRSTPAGLTLPGTRWPTGTYGNLLFVFLCAFDNYSDASLIVLICLPSLPSDLSVSSK